MFEQIAKQIYELMYHKDHSAASNLLAEASDEDRLNILGTIADPYGNKLASIILTFGEYDLRKNIANFKGLNETQAQELIHHTTATRYNYKNIFENNDAQELYNKIIIVRKVLVSRDYYLKECMAKNAISDWEIDDDKKQLIYHLTKQLLAQPEKLERLDELAKLVTSIDPNTNYHHPFQVIYKFKNEILKSLENYSPQEREQILNSKDIVGKTLKQHIAAYGEKDLLQECGITPDSDISDTLIGQKLHQKHNLL